MSSVYGSDDMDDALAAQSEAERASCAECQKSRHYDPICRHRGSRFWRQEQRGREVRARLDEATRAAELRYRAAERRSMDAQLAIALGHSEDVIV